MLLRMIWHLQWNVAKNKCSLKFKCQQNITRTEMSIKQKGCKKKLYYLNWNVTKTEISLKMKCH